MTISLLPLVWLLRFTVGYLPITTISLLPFGVAVTVGYLRITTSSLMPLGWLLPRAIYLLPLSPYLVDTVGPRPHAGAALTVSLLPLPLLPITIVAAAIAISLLPLSLLPSPSPYYHCRCCHRHLPIAIVAAAIAISLLPLSLLFSSRSCRSAIYSLFYLLFSSLLPLSFVWFCHCNRLQFALSMIPHRRAQVHGYPDAGLGALLGIVLYRTGVSLTGVPTIESFLSAMVAL